MAGKTAKLLSLTIPSAVTAIAHVVGDSLLGWLTGKMMDPLYDRIPHYIKWIFSFDLNIGIIMGIFISVLYLKGRKIIPAALQKRADKNKIVMWRALVDETYTKASCGVSIREALARDKRFDSLKKILSSDDLYLVNTTFVSVRAFTPGAPPPSVPDEAKILPALDKAIDRAERMVSSKKGIQKLT